MNVYGFMKGYGVIARLGRLGRLGRLARSIRQTMCPIRSKIKDDTLSWRHHVAGYKYQNFFSLL